MSELWGTAREAVAALAAADPALRRFGAAQHRYALAPPLDAAALAAAEAALADRTRTLAQLAARGIAYARIYADAHPEHAALAAKLDGAAPPPPAPVAPVRRRGRPPRAARTELPFAPAAAPDAG